MARYLFVVFTAAYPGKDEAFNEWYDSEHISDVLAVDGFESATRYALAPTEAGQSVLPPYMSLYEVETDNVTEAFAALGRARADGQMRSTETVDSSQSLWSFYRPI